MRWAELFRVQFVCPTVSVGLPTLPANKPRQMDTSPLLEMEVLEIGFLKRFRAVGPDGLSLSCLKDGWQSVKISLQNA